MQESMSRPLFEEPSADCEREDEWSGPKGFMFGGWSLPSGTTWEMAEQYFDAANQLIQSILSGKIEDYRLGTPVLFLYRHWLELAVKSIIKPTYGHDLAKLSDNLVTHFVERGVEVPKWITDRLLEIADKDPGSTAFRYAGGTVDGEIYVSLPHLRDSMMLMYVALASASHKGVFPPESQITLIANDPESYRSRVARMEWIS
jgi:hypothetical protein